MDQKSVTTNTIREAIKGLSPDDRERFTDYVGEFRTLSAAEVLFPGLPYEQTVVVSRAIGGMYDPRTVPPSVTPGVSLEEAAEASDAVIMAIAGMQYGGAGPSQEQLARWAACFSG